MPTVNKHGLEFVSTKNLMTGDTLVMANDPNKSEVTVVRVIGNLGAMICTADGAHIAYMFKDLIRQKALIVRRMLRVFFINHNYFHNRPHETLEEALKAAKSYGFDCSIHEGDKIVATWGVIEGTNYLESREEIAR